MKHILTLLIFNFFLINAQNNKDFSELSIQTDNLEDTAFINYIKKHTTDSQFLMIGEQHGIKEVGIFTNALYNVVKDNGYNTLCIETDPVAATHVYNIAKSRTPIKKAKETMNKYPYAIPFYNNGDDYKLFTNVVSNNGKIWGIDQTFMVQFRMNFDYLSNITTDDILRKKLITLSEKANVAYQKAISTKKYDAAYIFHYDQKTHQELLSLARNNKEKEIIEQLWLTKKIYEYNWTKKYYLNNNLRGQLMKNNFTNYYKNATKNNDSVKVIFKLGANHAAKGLTKTNIYDISNLISELAIYNNKTSLHYMVMGISGQKATGNPFAPVPKVPFDNTQNFPEEIKYVIPSINKKYYILNLAGLRPFCYDNYFTKAFKKMIFAYDFLVLVKDAEALEEL